MTRYLYEYDKVVLEIVSQTGQPDKVNRNIYGTNLLMREADGLSLYYMYNGHADVTALIDATTGTTRATYYYDAFGNIDDEQYFDANGDPTSTPINNSIMYAGYQYDKETGLYYLNARMYDPKIARFLQEDTYTGNPNDPLSLNLYTYVKNNPLIYYDPTGHWEDEVEEQFAWYYWDTDDYMKMSRLGRMWNEYNNLSKYPSYWGVDHEAIRRSMDKIHAEANSLRDKNNVPGTYKHIEHFKIPVGPNNYSNKLSYDPEFRSTYSYGTSQQEYAYYFTYNEFKIGSNRRLTHSYIEQHASDSPINFKNISEYAQAAIMQMALGEFGGEGNLLGTAGQVGLGLVGADIHVDVLDFTHSIYHCEWTWSHAGETTLNTIAFIPLVGSVKYLKHGDKLKHVDEIASGVKGIKKIYDPKEISRLYEGLADNRVLLNHSDSVLKNNPSKALAAELEYVGIKRPNFPSQAHHLVSVNQAKEAVKKLESLGINVNSSANGVFLPAKAIAGNPQAIHSFQYSGMMRHGDEYIKMIERGINEANTYDEAMDFLNDVRKGLLDGSIDLYK